MKIVCLLASICFASLLIGCTDTSLQTDEEYTRSKGPAPYAPDYSNNLPNAPSTYDSRRF